MRPAGLELRDPESVFGQPVWDLSMGTKYKKSNIFKIRRKLKRSVFSSKRLKTIGANKG